MSPSPHVPISKWYLLGAAAGLVALAAWWMSSPGFVVVTDLVDHFPNATQVRPAPEVFHVADVSLNGESKRSIYVTDQSRMIFTETISRDAWLQVSLGLREEAWSREGPGVLFMVGVSGNDGYEELVSLIVNPYANEADRAWLPVLLDLSPWAGQQVELIFNTREAYPGAGTANHLAVWGAPAIVTR